MITEGSMILSRFWLDYSIFNLPLCFSAHNIYGLVILSAVPDCVVISLLEKTFVDRSRATRAQL